MRKIVYNIFKKIAHKFAKLISSDIQQSKKFLPSTNRDKLSQLILLNNYRNFYNIGKNIPSFHEAEFKAYSQSGEDGILLLIFALIGATNRKCLEICAGDGIECNTANLIINHGWNGFLIDGSRENIEKGKAFYSSLPETHFMPPVFINEWITVENINSILSNSGIAGTIDLLSLDIDGIDYWLLKELDVVSPRVIVLEYQCILGPEKSVTVPYDPEFKAVVRDGFGIYNSASLMAFIKLLKNKNYRLVGCQRYGFNAFFIKNGIGDAIFPEISPYDCFRDNTFAEFAIKKYYSQVSKFNWIEV